MNQKMLETLEYNKILERLIERATSDPGREACRKLEPMTDPAVIEKAQQETEDALSMLLRKGSTSFGGNKVLTASLRALEIGSCLSQTEILKVAGLLENVNRIKAYGKPAREDEPATSLSDLFERLVPLTGLAAEIRRCLLSEDEVADDASPDLKRIRRSIAATGDKIHSQLTGMVNSSLRSYLQDAVITMRDNRYCIPVKAEYKGQVPGMVHDQSSTGSTFFIEPAAVVELNNKLKELELQEQEEIERILAALSAQIGEHTEEIAEDQRIMTFLDFTFAKASLALEQNATRPVFHTEKLIRIRKGRHPLLPAQTAVPIDIRLGGEFDQLIITGPNTGGKTVSLKTLGLLTLMGQAGLHIPALDRSELSIFTRVYADIGDEQSIEQSLSTFSSHMTRIVKILKYSDANSLCLFDELCAGTDPTEGAALAIAILEQLHNRGICTVATTHYSELKVYALTSSGVENACCEFDVETLSPTYHLLIGIPGKSNAFAISRKLGLSERVLRAAERHLTQEDKVFEDMLTDLEKSRMTIEKERLAIESDKQETEELKKRLQEKNDRLDDAREKILRKANEEAREILQEAKTVADETIRVFQKAGPGASLKDLEKEREKVRSKINEKNDRLSLKAAAPVVKKPIKAEAVKKGEDVRIPAMGLTGIVLTLPDQKGNLFVQCGIMRTQVHISEIEPVEEIKKTGKGLSGRSAGAGKIKMAKSLSVSPEINLLGKTVDEALPELDKYLDDAYLAHLPSVRVVHGKGTGALRNAVQNHLKRVKYVKSFRLGEYGEGDAGVTIVTFKE